MKKIIADYKDFCARFMETIFAENEKSNDQDVNVFADIIEKISDFDIEIEIIGFWIYAKNSYNYRVQLKEIGFLFSAKHKAWFYNGQTKKQDFAQNKLLTK